jgi:hypothetical protein
MASNRSFTQARFSKPTLGQYAQPTGDWNEVPFSNEQNREADVLDAADARTNATMAADLEQARADQNLYGGGEASRQQAIDALLQARGLRQGRTKADVYFDPSGEAAVRESGIHQAERAAEHKAGLDTSVTRALIAAQGAEQRAGTAAQGGMDTAALKGFVDMMKQRQLLTPPDPNKPDTTGADIRGYMDTLPQAGGNLNLGTTIQQFKTQNAGRPFNDLLARFQDQYEWDALNPAERAFVVQQLGGQGFR